MSTINLRELGLVSGHPLDELAGNSGLALEEAAAALDLESWIVERLRHPVDEIDLLSATGSRFRRRDLCPAVSGAAQRNVSIHHWELCAALRSSTSYLRSDRDGAHLAGGIARPASRWSILWSGLRSG